MSLGRRGVRKGLHSVLLAELVGEDSVKNSGNFPRAVHPLLLASVLCSPRIVSSSTF